MIKAVGQLHGKPLLILGLTHEDVRRLKRGEPIVLQAEAFGLAPMRIALIHGATEASLAADVEANFKVTQVHGDFPDE